MWRVALAGALLGFASAAGAATEATITPPEQIHIERSLKLGRQLYELDRAAWVSTDDLAAKASSDVAASIRGWVVEPVGTAFRATYYGMRGGEPYAIYRADVEAGALREGRMVGPLDDVRLTPLQIRMVRARDAAMAVGKVPCSQAAFNTVVLPMEGAEGALSVYLLTPQTTAGQVPFGGHYKIDVGPDGKVMGLRAFTKACLTLPVDPRAVAAGVTHLLDPVPTEVHVFLSLLIGKPVYVGVAGDRAWVVDGNAIRPAEAKPEPPANDTAAWETLILLGPTLMVKQAAKAARSCGAPIKTAPNGRGRTALNFRPLTKHPEARKCLRAWLDANPDHGLEVVWMEEDLKLLPLR